MLLNGFLHWNHDETKTIFNIFFFFIYMYNKIYSNNKLNITLNVYADNKQNIWFIGRDVANILGYSDTNQAIRKHVDLEDKFKGAVKTTGGF